MSRVRNKVWTENVELELVKLCEKSPKLWLIDDEKDIKIEEKIELGSIRNSLNTTFERNFDLDDVADKWMEIILLFDCKYAMNGYTMEDRGHHIRRDGSLKDDLNESWKYFKPLTYLAEPRAAMKKKKLQPQVKINPYHC